MSIGLPAPAPGRRRTPARCARPCLNADFRNAIVNMIVNLMVNLINLRCPTAFPASSRYQVTVPKALHVHVLHLACAVHLMHWSHRRPTASSRSRTARGTGGTAASSAHKALPLEGSLRSKSISHGTRLWRELTAQALCRGGAAAGVAASLVTVPVEVTACDARVAQLPRRGARGRSPPDASPARASGEWRTISRK